MRKCMIDVAEFHHKFGVEQPAYPTPMPAELARFRLEAMAEELQEYAHALGYEIVIDIPAAPLHEPDPEKQMDALVDLTYFTVGTGLCSGFDMDEAWDRVHEKNMQKQRALPDGSDSLRMSKYDVVKGPGWTPPDLSDLVDEAHPAPVQLRYAQMHSDAFGVLPGERR